MPAPETPERAALRVDPLVSIGQVASAWSGLEYAIDDAIWTLAGLSHEKGACITALLPGMGARIEVFQSLLEAVGCSQPLKDAITKFKASSVPLGLERNRVIHDPIAINEYNEVVVIRQGTKDRKLQHGEYTFDLAKNLQLNEDIYRLRGSFINIRDLIYDEVFSSPEIPV